MIQRFHDFLQTVVREPLVMTIANALRFLRSSKIARSNETVVVVMVVIIVMVMVVIIVMVMVVIIVMVMVVIIVMVMVVIIVMVMVVIVVMVVYVASSGKILLSLTHTHSEIQHYYSAKENDWGFSNFMAWKARDMCSY